MSRVTRWLLTAGNLRFNGQAIGARDQTWRLTIASYISPVMTGQLPTVILMLPLSAQPQQTARPQSPEGRCVIAEQHVGERVARVARDINARTEIEADRIGPRGLLAVAVHVAVLAHTEQTDGFSQDLQG
ncbi:MAG: hypothetical protein AB7U82_34265 [Blastocatellales bacterium]